VLVFGASKIYLESLSPWNERETFGLNAMKSSSIFKFSYLSYSNAHELEYSCIRVIIMIYELAYSLCVMIMTCFTLCLTLHTIYMMMIRAKLRWWFVVPSGVPMSYACRSVGSKSDGDMGSFLVNGRGAQVQRSRRIHFPCHS
jgi:hypothetical protein